MIFRTLIALAITLSMLTGASYADGKKAEVVLASEGGIPVLLFTGRVDSAGEVEATTSIATQDPRGLGLDEAGDLFVDGAGAVCAVSFSFEKGFKVGDYVLPFACALRDGNPVFLPLEVGNY